MNKPEVICWYTHNAATAKPEVDFDDMSDSIAYEPLIRLTDHEAAMAELREKLELAKDESLALQAGIQCEAERNELLGLLREVSGRATLTGWEPGLTGGINATLERHKC